MKKTKKRKELEKAVRELTGEQDNKWDWVMVGVIICLPLWPIIRFLMG